MAEAAKPLDNEVRTHSDCAARRYVNQIDLSFSLSEVRIDFGQEFAELEQSLPQCRLITSPVHLRRIGHQISQTIDRYESRFGVIPVSDDGGSIG